MVRCKALTGSAVKGLSIEDDLSWYVSTAERYTTEEWHGESADHRFRRRRPWYRKFEFGVQYDTIQYNTIQYNIRLFNNDKYALRMVEVIQNRMIPSWQNQRPDGGLSSTI